MRESVGLTYIIGFIAFFFGIFIIFFIGSLSYSKAFKVKNKIINIIEENGKYDYEAREDINNNLRNIGYRIGASSKVGCPDDEEGTNLADQSMYHYCVYEKTTTRGTYYKVITYIYFDFPIIGSHLEFPVSGETRVLGDIFD